MFWYKKEIRWTYMGEIWSHEIYWESWPSIVCSGKVNWVGGVSLGSTLNANFRNVHLFLQVVGSISEAKVFHEVWQRTCVLKASAVTIRWQLRGLKELPSVNEEQPCRPPSPGLSIHLKKIGVGKRNSISTFKDLPTWMECLMLVNVQAIAHGRSDGRKRIREALVCPERQYG